VQTEVRRDQTKNGQDVYAKVAQRCQFVHGALGGAQSWPAVVASRRRWVGIEYSRAEEAAEGADGSSSASEPAEEGSDDGGVG
jgi:hypothetical protein